MCSIRRRQTRLPYVLTCVKFFSLLSNTIRHTRTSVRLPDSYKSMSSLPSESIMGAILGIAGRILSLARDQPQPQPRKPLTPHDASSYPSPPFSKSIPGDWPTQKSLNTPSLAPGLRHPQKPLAGRSVPLIRDATPHRVRRPHHDSSLGLGLPVSPNAKPLFASPRT